jgi:titin
MRRSHTNYFARLLALLVVAASTARAAIITVTGTGDTIAADGMVTLREAITAANNNAPSGDAPAGDPFPIVDEIHFNIAPGGVQTVQLLSELPGITDPVSINGWTQPGFSGSPIIELDGSLIPNEIGLLIDAGNSTVRGLVISGFTDNFSMQIGTAGGNVIEGNYIGTDVDGLVRTGGGMVIASDGNRIGTDGDGINDALERNILGISLAGNANVIAGNFIAVDATGTQVYGSATSVSLFLTATASFNLIGTDGDGVADEAERNVIGAVVDCRGPDNVFAGNHIGVDLMGTAALASVSTRISISDRCRLGTDGNGVADLSERNLISGGVSVNGNDCVISGNYIGTDITGTIAFGSGQVGVTVKGNGCRIGTNGDGLADEHEGNLISGNGNGVYLFTRFNIVAGNFIGTDVTGTKRIKDMNGNPVGNIGSGIRILGGPANRLHSNRIGTNGDGVADEAERNVISGNGDVGVNIHTGDSNVVAGNFIGTDVTGTERLGNGGYGVSIVEGRFNRVEGNVVSDNAWGIKLDDLVCEQNAVVGNLVGTDVTGMVGLGNHRNGISVGGLLNRIEGNLVSSNDAVGVVVGGEQNVVTSNLIGAKLNGAEPLGNARGVQLSGSSHDNLVESNVIAANRDQGIFLFESGVTRNVIAGNFIGTDATGMIPLGNGTEGILLQAGPSDNTIGGTLPGTGNTIAFNGTSGVALWARECCPPPLMVGNAIRGNSIHSNVGLGIDLRRDGPTPNDALDADDGENRLQNFPVVLEAHPAGGSTTIQGTLHSAPNTTFSLDFFANSSCAPDGFCEGKRFLGSATVTTDSAGNANFNITLPSPTVINELVTATATDPGGNTSEFSVSVNVEPNLFAEDAIIWHQPLARNGASEDTDPSAGGTLKYRFKLGSTIPIQVHAMGADGTDVTANSNVMGKVEVFGDTNCDGVADGNALPIDYNGVGEAGGVMDKIDGHLKYNLDTKKLPQTAQCFILQVTVTDTSTGESRSEIVPLQAK